MSFWLFNSSFANGLHKQSKSLLCSAQSTQTKHHSYFLAEGWVRVDVEAPLTCHNEEQS